MDPLSGFLLVNVRIVDFVRIPEEVVPVEGIHWLGVNLSGLENCSPNPHLASFTHRWTQTLNFFLP